MNHQATRLRFDPEYNTLSATCTTCGNVSPPLVGSDHLEWLPLSTVLDLAKHTCRPGPWPVAPPTPRPVDQEMASFVERVLIIDASGVVPFARLLDLFETATGTYPDSGLFSRRLRAMLPPGVEIRREMINGERARRLVGMRLR